MGNQGFLIFDIFSVKAHYFFYMNDNFCCPKCGNQDSKYIGFRNGQAYCRRCLSFQGSEAAQRFYPKRNIKPLINYELTSNQSIISQKVVENFKANSNTLIYAVTGAGKTELVFAVIVEALNQGLQVGFTIPRKDVVIELSERLKSAFPTIEIAVVYGGHVDNLEGQIVILTTHQLYRYPHYFDLLIFDEIDAFPFVDNDLLITMFRRSVRGNYVLMSATPSRQEINEFRSSDTLLTLFERFHHHPLPVPVLIIRILGFQYLYLLRKCQEWKKNAKPFLIFVPTIEQTEMVFRFINIFVKNGNYVHSLREHRAEIITSFKNKNLSFLVTTSVLERGITIENLQVLIFNAHHPLFNQKALVQISGRVGRKLSAPEGEVIFLANEITREMEGAIADTKSKNQFL